MYHELFTRGYCVTKSLEDFLSSKVAHVIGLMQGELMFTAEPCLNFYNVHQSGDTYVISEAIFTDFFPDTPVVGTIIPRRVFYRTHNNHRGTLNPNGYLLSRRGYTLIKDNSERCLIEELKDTSFIEVEDKSGIENHTITETTNTYQEHKQHYEVSMDCYNASVNQIKDYVPAFLEEKVALNREIVSMFLYGSPLLQKASNRSVMVQRMTEGQELDRHFDNSMTGIDPHLVNMVTWYMEGEVDGREMVCGHRTEKHLLDWIDKAQKMDGNSSCGLHEDVTGENVDTIKVIPENKKSIMLNAVNPYFYHGVLKHRGGSNVYTILNDFGIYE
jgi:hypothetical protein